MNALTFGIVLAIMTPGALGSELLPTLYESGHFYATPRATSGTALKLLVDTGGGGSRGMYWISQAAAERIGLRARLPSGRCDLNDVQAQLAPLPRYQPSAEIPRPLGDCRAVLVLPDSIADGSDGQLGAPYLSTRIWTFDYPRHRLLLQSPGWHPAARLRSITLAFARDGSGRRLGYPRISINVVGEAIDLLLDTGATSKPSATARELEHADTTQGIGVASYITSDVLDRWHSHHPEWRMLDDGDDLLAPNYIARVIEVPVVQIGGRRIGPVWFTERPVRGFHSTLDALMDRPVVGALGGNALQSFAITIDYAHDKAWLGD